jgi:hypothetical protein
MVGFPPLRSFKDMSRGENSGAGGMRSDGCEKPKQKIQSNLDYSSERSDHLWEFRVQ